MAAFDTFDQYALGHYVGQIADVSLADIVSRNAQEVIQAGLAVVDGADRAASLGNATSTPTGIAARMYVSEVDAETGNPVMSYAEGDEMTVLRLGRIWVETVGGAAVGDDVYVTSTGELTNTDNAGANLAFPNATFKSAADAGGIALVQLNGSD
jgi:hypothetical protein